MSFSDDSPAAEGPAASEEPAPQKDEPVTPPEDQLPEETFIPEADLISSEGPATPSAPLSDEDIIVPEENEVPEGFTPLERNARLARSRRRRAARMLVPPSDDERAILLDDLARRAFPSFEFFLFALLCGAVLGAAYLLESPALLLLGILMAPLLTPWVGLTLATMTGSWLFFMETLMGMAVAGGLVFGTGVLAGWAGRMWAPLTLFHANIHAHLWWTDLFLVALGAILLVLSFIRSEEKPRLPSIMLAYGLFLPVSAAGVGLGIGNPQLWPDGALVFLVHLALAAVVSCVTLAAMRFKPIKVGGYALPVIAGLASVTALVTLTGAFNLTNLIGDLRDSINNSRHTVPTATLALPAASLTPTLQPTATLTLTPAFTDTLQPTDTVQPTPAFAVIAAESGGGAVVRNEPGYTGTTILASLINGMIVEVLPETKLIGTTTWVHVRLTNGITGWVVQPVLVATTQVPTVPPTLSPTP